MEKVIERAIRGKYRFQYKGNATIEDLWDLPPVELDCIYKDLLKAAKDNDVESLLTVKTTEDIEIKDKIEIIKHIILVKLDEQEAAEKAIRSKAEAQKIMHIIESKMDDVLKDKSIEELKEMLNHC